MRLLNFFILVIASTMLFSDAYAYEAPDENVTDPGARDFQAGEASELGNLRLVTSTLGHSTAPVGLFREASAPRLQLRNVSNDGDAAVADDHSALNDDAVSEPRFPLVPRLFVGAATNFGVSAVVAIPALLLFVFAVAGTALGDLPTPAFFSLLAVAGAIGIGGFVFLAPLAVKTVGDYLGGEGTYLGTILGALGGIAAVLLFAGIAEMTPLGQSDAGEFGSLLVPILALFGPVIGYEISSHQQQKSRPYQVGITPLVGPSPYSERSFQGAAMSIKMRF